MHFCKTVTVHIIVCTGKFVTRCKYVTCKRGRRGRPPRWRPRRRTRSNTSFAVEAAPDRAKLGHDSRDAPLLCTYFTQFGEVIDYVVMKNAETGRSRGFGFFTFADRGNIDAGISCTLCTFMYVITHLLILLQSLSDIMTTSGQGQKQEGKFSR